MFFLLPPFHGPRKAQAQNSKDKKEFEYQKHAKEFQSRRGELDHIYTR